MNIASLVQSTRVALLIGIALPVWMTSSVVFLLLIRATMRYHILYFDFVVQVAFQEHDGQCTRSAFELVKCKLTLLYDYWQLNEVFHFINSVVRYIYLFLLLV